MSSATASFVLRPARVQDLDRIAEIETASFSCPWPKRLIRREILARGSSRFTVAASPSSGEVLGYIAYSITTDEIHILNLATEPNHRRRGIARGLVLACLEGGREAGATIAHLEVRESNTMAIGLYTRLGFRHVGERPNYYINPVEDALLFSLDLNRARGAPAGESS